MAIVERVEASVDFRFPNQTGACTVKELEEYLFNARMRGAEDESKVTFNTEPRNSYSYYTASMTVAVPATMGGFPVVDVPSQRMNPRRKAEALAVFGVFVFLSLVGIVAAVLLAGF